MLHPRSSPNLRPGWDHRCLIVLLFCESMKSPRMVLTSTHTLLCSHILNCNQFNHHKSLILSLNHSRAVYIQVARIGDACRTHQLNKPKFGFLSMYRLAICQHLNYKACIYAVIIQKGNKTILQVSNIFLGRHCIIYMYAFLHSLGMIFNNISASNHHKYFYL